MIGKLSGYIAKNLLRHPVRTAMTVIGIGIAMFLFCFIESLQSGVRAATESAATRNLLIVYQKGRFCPSTSRLPERYAAAIARIPGVVSVLPVKIFVNNCRASLDSVTFRGVPPERVTGEERRFEVVAGGNSDFQKSRDAAVVGSGLAARRNLKPGDRFQIGHVAVAVAAVFKSDVPGENNVAYTHLEYLQQAQGVNSVGQVTQFEVATSDASQSDAIAKAIDALFRSDEVATVTKSHQAFVSAATGDLLGLIRFSRWLGIVCVVVVLALTANTIFVMVQDRVKEHAVLQTIGFPGHYLFGMVLGESVMLSLAGGLLGTAAAVVVLQTLHLGLGSEGVQITFMLSPMVIYSGLVVSLLTGILAGLAPAIQSSLAPIVDSLRRV